MAAPDPTRRTGLTKGETRTALRSFNWNLAMRAVFDQVCAGTGMFFTAFAVALGVKKEDMGVIGALVGLACLLQLLGMVISGRAKNKKRQALALAMLEPVVLIGAVLVTPLLPPSMRLLSLSASIFAAAGFLFITKPMTDEWLASTVPAGLRGRYIGRRFQLLAVFAILISVAMGVFGDWLKSLGSPQALGLALVIGAVFGLLALLPLRRAKLPTATAMSTINWSEATGVFRDSGYMRFMLAIVIYNLAFYVTIPFYNVYYLEDLHMSMTLIASMGVAYHVVKIPMLRFWTPLIDRLGHKLVIAMVGPVYVMFFALLASARPAPVVADGVPLWAKLTLQVVYAWPAVLAWAIAAVGDSGFGVAYQTALYGAVPNRPGRQAYFATINLVTLGIYSVGALVGRQILTMLQGVTLELGPVRLGQFQVFFAGASLVMAPAIAGVLLIGRRDAAAARAEPRESLRSASENPLAHASQEEPVLVPDAVTHEQGVGDGVCPDYRSEPMPAAGPPDE